MHETDLTSTWLNIHILIDPSLYKWYKSSENEDILWNIVEKVPCSYLIHNKTNDGYSDAGILSFLKYIPFQKEFDSNWGYTSFNIHKSNDVTLVLIGWKNCSDFSHHQLNIFIVPSHVSLQSLTFETVSVNMILYSLGTLWKKL